MDGSRSTIRVDSEIGRLRRVMIHRPGLEIDRMMPSMMERLLFDDILDGEEARAEHSRFRAVLEAAGVEVLDAGQLLAEVLEENGLPAELQDLLERDLGESRSVLEQLAELPPREAAQALIQGVRVPESERPIQGRYFALDPVPNYFFQRDPQVVIGDRVMHCSMAADARDRESLLARAIFHFNPRLAGASGRFRIEPEAPGPRRVRHASARYPTLEGGDVLVASPEILLVGVSERTNRRGVQRLAEILHAEETGFRHLVVVELPLRRSCMHLDTIFTLIDHGLCLAYLPMIATSGLEAVHSYTVDLTARELMFRPETSFLDTLSRLGMDLEPVACGGPDDPVAQEREQWTDGANAFAIAPGVIVLYRRNRRTVDELVRRGWRVLEDRQVLDDGEAVLGHGPTVISLSGPELSRARGGPRCMTAPLERDSL